MMLQKYDVFFCVFSQREYLCKKHMWFLCLSAKRIPYLCKKHQKTLDEPSHGYSDHQSGIWKTAEMPVKATKKKVKGQHSPQKKKKNKQTNKPTKTKKKTLKQLLNKKKHPSNLPPPKTLNPKTLYTIPQHPKVSFCR